MFDPIRLAQEATIEAALEHPQFFHARYFQNERRGIGAMPSFHVEWFNLASRSKRVLLLAPRDHAKTTVLSVEYPIWRLCQWRWAMMHGRDVMHPRMGILSDTEGQSEDILRAIVLNLETNDKLLADFGKWRPEPARKWTTLSIIVDGWHAPNEKDVTIYAGGYESAWLGKRFDLLIADDLPNLKRNSATENARSQLSTFWREVVTNTLEEDSQLVYVATMQHHQDLSNQIIADERARRKAGIPRLWEIRRYKAILQESSATSPAKVLWPDHFSYEKLLERRREIGTAAFEKMFQNIPVNEDILAFRVNWLRDRCLDRGHAIGQVEGGWGIYMGVDPAIGESQWSSFFAVVVLAVDNEKNFHILDYVKDKLALPRQEKIIAELWEKYRPLQVRIETMAYQKALAQSLKEKYPLIRVLPHLTQRNKIDPEAGVVSMLAPMVENGLLRLPYKTPESIRRMDTFIDDLSLWPANNSDLVMALWIAATGAREAAMMSYARAGQWGTTVKNPMFIQPYEEPFDKQTGLPLSHWFTPELNPERGITLDRGV